MILIYFLKTCDLNLIFISCNLQPEEKEMHHHLHLGKSQRYAQQMDKQIKTQIPNQMKIQNLEKESQTQRQMQIQKQIQKQKKRVEVEVEVEVEMEVEVEQGKKDLLMKMKEMEMQLKNPLLMKIFQIMLSSYSSS